jgi:hypothetical protein
MANCSLIATVCASSIDALKHAIVGEHMLENGVDDIERLLLVAPPPIDEFELTADSHIELIENNDIVIVELCGQDDVGRASSSSNYDVEKEKEKQKSKKKNKGKRKHKALMMKRIKKFI